MTRVVVVGGGVIGLSVAAELAGQGAQVLVLERNSEPGREASWAAAGIVCPQGEAKAPGPFFDLLSAGFAAFPEAVERIREETGVEVRAERNGMLSLAFTEEDEAQLRREAGWQGAAGIRAEPVTAAEVRRREPAVDGALRGGFWYPDVIQADVRRFVEGYRRLLESRGGRVRTGVAATRFLLDGRRVAGVETSSGVVRADWVVNCAGSWAGFDRSLPFQVPAVPARGQILKLATEKALIRSVVHSRRGYLVQRSATELIAGTTVEYAGFDSSVTPEGMRSIRAGAAEISSRTATLPEADQWAGLRPDTPDHLPVLGATPVEGLILAAGHFRSGMILAPVTGRAVSDLILRGGSSLDLTPFSVTRFLANGETATTGGSHRWCA